MMQPAKPQFLWGLEDHTVTLFWVGMQEIVLGTHTTKKYTQKPRDLQMLAKTALTG